MLSISDGNSDLDALSCRIGFRKPFPVLMGLSQSIPQNAEEIRQEAQLAFSEANLCYSRSQEAWNRGDKATARKEKEKRIELQNKAKMLNQQASEIAYNENNKNRKLNEVDLHGLTVPEALDAVEKAIVIAKQHKYSSMVIITGQGNNSENGAKLKPKVTDQLINKHNLKCIPNHPNPGCITIEFVPSGGFIGWVSNICCIQ